MLCVARDRRGHGHPDTFRAAVSYMHLFVWPGTLCELFGLGGVEFHRCLAVRFRFQASLRTTSWQHLHLPRVRPSLILTAAASASPASGPEREKNRGPLRWRAMQSHRGWVGYTSVPCPTPTRRVGTPMDLPSPRGKGISAFRVPCVLRIPYRAQRTTNASTGINTASGLISGGFAHATHTSTSRYIRAVMQFTDRTIQDEGVTMPPRAAAVPFAIPHQCRNNYRSDAGSTDKLAMKLWRAKHRAPQCTETRSLAWHYTEYGVEGAKFARR